MALHRKSELIMSLSLSLLSRNTAQLQRQEHGFGHLDQLHSLYQQYQQSHHGHYALQDETWTPKKVCFSLATWPGITPSEPESGDMVRGKRRLVDSPASDSLHSVCPSRFSSCLIGSSLRTAAAAEISRSGEWPALGACG